MKRPKEMKAKMMAEATLKIVRSIIDILQKIAIKENITSVDELYNFVMAMSDDDLKKYQIEKE